MRPADCCDTNLQHSLLSGGSIVVTYFLDGLPVVLQTFFVDDDLKDACQLDAVLTVVDSKHLVQHLDEVKPEDVVNEAGM